MKIAHVQVKPILSGAQQVSYDILSSLNGEEHQLYVICAEFDENSTDFIKKFQSIGVEIITIPTLKRELGVHDFKVIWDLYSVFRKYQFDIVHTNSTKPGICARIAARLANTKKIIHTVHGIAFHKHVSLIKRCIFYFAELFSLYFGHINVSVNKFYSKYYPLIETQTIYNGVDFSNLTFNKNILNIQKGIHFAFFSRLDEQKNPLDFIHAIFLLKTEGLLSKNLTFSIAGDGELKEKCQEQLEEYSLQDCVKLVGWVSDKSSFLNTVDVLCQPSRWEAFGLVFVEAAFFEIPSIASNVEGIPEVVLDGVTGLLCDAEAISLKNCMIKFIENPDLIKKMGKEARLRAINKFDKGRMVKQYTSIYFDDGV